MGWAALAKPVSEYGRKILRAIWTDADPYAHCNCDSNSYANAVTDASSNTDTEYSPNPEESTHASAASIEASLVSQAADPVGQLG